jgi:hypothetical protein
VLHQKDVCKIEIIQRCATKLVPIVKDLSYENRLKTLGLPTLEYRRDRYDMIKVYKALHDEFAVTVSSDKLFQ